MVSDSLAIGLLIGTQLITSVIFFYIGRRQLKVALATMSIVIDSKIQTTVDEIGGVLGEVFEKPNVKKAMSIIGSQGGTASANKDLTERIALDVLNGPKFAGLKLAASAVGMDIDSYIEGHGAVNTFNSIQSLAGMIPNFDLGSMLQGGTSLSVGHEANHKEHPYLT